MTDILNIPDTLGSTPCAETDPAIFFPDQAQSTLKIARKICQTQCSVRTECLQLAMKAEKGLAARWRYGIYGGLSPRQRANLDPNVDTHALCEDCGESVLTGHLARHKRRNHSTEEMAA